MNNKNITISSLSWENQPKELLLAQGKAVEALGYEHEFFLYDEEIPPKTQIILVQGPYNTLYPLVDQLVDRSSGGKRPVFVYWFGESLTLFSPFWLLDKVSRTFSKLHQCYGDLRGLCRVVKAIAPRIVETRGNRLGFLGDIVWLHEHGLLDELVLSSTVYAEYLKKYNIPSIVVPRGCAPSYGSMLNMERDIPVVWMGKLRTRRRRKAIFWLKSQLEEMGLTMHIYDGEHADFIFGEKRTEILNRAWFVLNILSAPLDELSIRYFVAGANGAVILSEPGPNKYPFVPGKHIVESTIEEMPGIIAYYLHHKDEWQAISDNMHDLLKNKLTLRKSIEKILGEVVSLTIDKSTVAQNRQSSIHIGDDGIQAAENSMH